jgi:nitrogen fixation/metabolism regulation signal transduction histidine kinase
MKRNQVYLTDKEDAGIIQIIKDNGGGTKAEHIRRALDEYIEKHKSKTISLTQSPSN